MQPDRVHPDPRADRPDPRGRPLGPSTRRARRWPRGTPEATPWTSRSTCRAANSTTTPSSTTSATRSQSAVFRHLAHHRGDRDRADAQCRRHRPTPARDQGPRRQDRRRRLRYRLLVPRLPPTVPGRLPQDRPDVHERHHDVSRIEGPDRYLRPTRQETSGSGPSPKASRPPDEMDNLMDEHVDEAQGFLLARPLDASTIEAEFLVPGRLHKAETSVSPAAK